MRKKKGVSNLEFHFDAVSYFLGVVFACFVLKGIPFAIEKTNDLIK